MPECYSAGLGICEHARLHLTSVSDMLRCKFFVNVTKFRTLILKVKSVPNVRLGEFVDPAFVLEFPGRHGREQEKGGGGGTPHEGLS